MAQITSAERPDTVSALQRKGSPRTLTGVTWEQLRALHGHCQPARVLHQKEACSCVAAKRP